MASRETENNAYAKFWRDKQRTLWYVMVFLEWSIKNLLSPDQNFPVFRFPSEFEFPGFYCTLKKEKNNNTQG